MRPSLASALLLLAVAARSAAVPLPLPIPHSDLADSSQTSGSDDSDDAAQLYALEGDFESDSDSRSGESRESARSEDVAVLAGDAARGFGSGSAEGEAARLAKRDTPDPELCGCQHDVTSDPEHTHDNDLYLEYRSPYSRDRRQLEGDNTAEEESSEEKAKPEVEKAKAAEVDARRRRHVEGDHASEASSSEESSRRAYEEDNDATKYAADYSMEDYARGCEETEVDSDEANETTYDESRRKRGADDHETSFLKVLAELERSDEDATASDSSQDQDDTEDGSRKAAAQEGTSEERVKHAVDGKSSQSSESSEDGVDSSDESREQKGEARGEAKSRSRGQAAAGKQDAATAGPAEVAADQRSRASSVAILG